MAKDTPNAAPGGRPSKPDRTPVLVRFPPEVLEGVERRARREKIVSRNDAILEAAVEWGDFPGVRPTIVREKAAPKPPPSLASKVKTQTREPEKPGTRLKGVKLTDAAKRPAAARKTDPKPPAAEVEEAV